MVPAAIRRQSPADGLQPLRLARDWRQVINLIEVAFGEALDVEARRALRSMRPPPGLAPLIGLFDRMALPGEGVMPGFVWREGGRVVGTASVRRISTLSQGWLIANVAVHPDWQGQGIGRALVAAAVDFASDFGGGWVVLQVRDTNRVARQLYESLGFQAIGEITRLRKAGASTRSSPTAVAGFRPARWLDGARLSRLARTLTPHDVLWPDVLNRGLYRTGPLDRLGNRLKGRHRQWWVYDESEARPKGDRPRASWTGTALNAAVGLELDRSTPWHRLRVLIAPHTQDKESAAELIAFGLRQLVDAPPLPVEIEHPASDEMTHSALTEAGFERIYAFIHMRLILRSATL